MKAKNNLSSHQTIRKNRKKNKRRVKKYTKDTFKIITDPSHSLAMRAKRDKKLIKKSKRSVQKVQVN